MPVHYARCFEPTLGQLSSAIIWLRERGASPERLAVAFETNRNYIRVLTHRGRQGLALRNAAVSTDAASTDRRAVCRLAPSRDLEPLEDTGMPTPQQRRRLEAIEAAILDIRDRAAAEGALLRGVAELARVSPLLGRPASVALVRLRALLRYETAWCLAHSGLIRSATMAARRAIGDARYCFREADDPAFLRLMATIALVAAHAQLLTRRPRAAEAYLSVVRSASEMAKTPIPADYYRQTAIAAFQRGDDTRARHLLMVSSRVLADQEPSRTEVDVRFNEQRHTLCCTTVDWDSSLQLLSDVGCAFGRDSLQYSMMSHWSAAGGLLTDSPVLQRQSRDLLELNRRLASRFGHQATISRLLRLTPSLQLARPLRREWLRWLMYANAYTQS